jgi:hypothetical protein
LRPFTLSRSTSYSKDGNPVRVGARQDNGAGLALVASQEALILAHRFPLAGYTEAQFAFYGDIDTVRIYRRSRTAQEICSDANRRLVSRRLFVIREQAIRADSEDKGRRHMRPTPTKPYLPPRRTSFDSRSAAPGCHWPAVQVFAGAHSLK